jgi:hypothetical protein
MVMRLLSIKLLSLAQAVILGLFDVLNPLHS